MRAPSLQAALRRARALVIAIDSANGTCRNAVESQRLLADAFQAAEDCLASVGLDLGDLLTDGAASRTGRRLAEGVPDHIVSVFHDAVESIPNSSTRDTTAWALRDAYQLMARLRQCAPLTVSAAGALAKNVLLVPTSRRRHVKAELASPPNRAPAEITAPLATRDLATPHHDGWCWRLDIPPGEGSMRQDAGVNWHLDAATGLWRNASRLSIEAIVARAIAQAELQYNKSIFDHPPMSSRGEWFGKKGRP